MPTQNATPVILEQDNNPVFPVTDVSLVRGLGDAINGKVSASDLAAVATTGSYNSLSNTPVIPTVPALSADIAADATNDTKTTTPHAVATYVENNAVKPATGIGIKYVWKGTLAQYQAITTPSSDTIYFITE